MSNIVKINRVIMNPSKNISPEMLERQFVYRQTGEFIGESEIVLADIKEPVWWNRPLKSDALLKQESDGMFSYNLPYISHEESYKTGYNLLLGKNSLPIAVHLKIDDSWTNAQINGIRKMLTYAVLNALYDLGAPREKIALVNNDILYDGKKFVGDEQRLDGQYFTENMVITLNYTKEAELFNRLTGKYALMRGICGIIEETNCFTKEQFIDAIILNIRKYFKK